MPLVTAAGYPTAQIPSVSPSPTPGSDYQQIGGATPEAFGAGVGRAESQLGATAETAARGLESIAIEQQRLTNQVAANNSTNYAMDEATKILHGDPDKPGDVGYFGLKGIAAVNERQSTAKKLDDLIANSRTQLSNPRQQLMFDNETRRMRNYWMGQIGSHYDTQLTQSAIGSATAQETLATNGMSSAWANLDQQGADLHLETAMKAVMQKGQAAGWTQPQIDLELQRLRGTYTAQAVESIAAKDPLRARNFLENNKDALVKDEYRRLHGMVDVQADKQQAQEDVYGGAKKVPGVGGMVRGGAIQGRITDASVESTLDLINKYESPQGNVPNYRFDSTHTAGGYFQITNTTWKDFAAEAGVSVSEYPTAMSAPKDIQRQVARTILTSPNGGGIQHWSNFNPRLKQALQNGEAVAPPLNTTSGGLPDTVENKKAFDYWRTQGGGVNKDATYEQYRMLMGGAVGEQPAVTPVAAKGPQDQVLRPLPPREDGELPDTQVPGLVEKIQDLATKLPPPDTYENQRRWNSAVSLARKDLNAAYSDQQHAHRLQVEQQKAIDDKLEKDYTHKIFSPAGATMTATQIENEMNAAGASAAATQRMIGFYERQTKPDPASAVSAKNTSLLFDRINREWGDPTKINDMNPVRQAFVNQEITKASYDFLEKQINDSKTVEGESLQKEKKRLFEMYKHSITKSNPLMGQFDDEGDINFGRFEKIVDQAVDQAKAENRNPHDLFDETKPGYLGLQTKRFQKPLSDSASGIANKMKPNPEYQPPPGMGPPKMRQPGETVDQYLKRTGK